MEDYDIFKRMKETEKIVFKGKAREAYDAILEGKSIFLTGPAGTGKTTIIKHFNETYRYGKVIAITSTTGTSALLIGGTTLHSYLGIGLGQESVADLAERIMTRPYLKKRWNSLEVLVIDEVSMLSAELFDKLEELARTVRYGNLMNPKPFGGIQLILSGDFYQLPCVNGEFCFKAKSWSKCVSEIFTLTDIMRQTDTEFQNCLNNVRIGNLTEATLDTLHQCVGKVLEPVDGIIPTRLYSHNADVDALNESELDRLAEDGAEFVDYTMSIDIVGSVRDPIAERNRIIKNSLTPYNLQICKGAQVMLTINLDVANGLANGSRGVVIDFVNDLPMVRFMNGEERVIESFVRDVTENNLHKARVTQIPLKVAYALSIHKSQGCSLDYMIADLGKIFEYGQAYVALSRARSLEGLSIISLVPERIQAHPEVKEQGF